MELVNLLINKHRETKSKKKKNNDEGEMWEFYLM